MPKHTFFKISKEKQSRIINAARHEFLSVPYSEVSINRIIKQAEIPRGSFYQYFEDKEDLFYFTLQENKNSLFEILSNEIEKAEGDIFQCIERNIGRIVDIIYCDKSGKVRMLFSEPRILETIWMVLLKSEKCEKDVIYRFIDKINMKLLDVENESEMILLINILGVVIRDTLGNIFMHSEKIKKEDANRMLEVKIQTLKRHYSK